MPGDNHEYLWEKYLAVRSQRSEVVALDFGCGEGKLVSKAVSAGYTDFYGAETFYGDENFAQETTGTLTAATRERIKIIGDDGRLPFPDATFDFVCTNQVFEHIPQLEGVVDELARVTKPIGIHVHVLPTREVIVEGHVEIPLIHRLHGTARERLARWSYRRGHARFAETADSFEEWWGELGPFLSEQTFHRPWAEFERVLRRRFTVRHLEKEKLLFHLAQRPSPARTRTAAIVRRLPDAVVTAVEHRRVGAAIELQIAAQANERPAS